MRAQLAEECTPPFCDPPCGNLAWFWPPRMCCTSQALLPPVVSMHTLRPISAPLLHQVLGYVQSMQWPTLVGILLASIAATEESADEGGGSSAATGSPRLAERRPGAQSPPFPTTPLRRPGSGSCPPSPPTVEQPEGGTPFGAPPFVWSQSGALSRSIEHFQHRRPADRAARPKFGRIRKFYPFGVWALHTDETKHLPDPWCIRGLLRALDPDIDQ